MLDFMTKLSMSLLFPASFVGNIILRLYHYKYGKVSYDLYRECYEEFVEGIKETDRLYNPMKFYGFLTFIFTILWFGTALFGIVMSFENFSWINLQNLLVVHVISFSVHIPVKWYLIYKFNKHNIKKGFA